MYSAYKLNKQDENIQPWHNSFPIWNQSFVPCSVLTTASWPAYRFLSSQVRRHLFKNFPVFLFFCFFFLFLSFARLQAFSLVNSVQSVQSSLSVMSYSLWSHESQHSSPSCPLSTPRIHSDSRPSSQWCHPAISSSVVPFSCPRSEEHTSELQSR